MSACHRIGLKASLCAAVGLAAACGGCLRGDQAVPAPAKDALPANSERAKVEQGSPSAGPLAVVTEPASQPKPVASEAPKVEPASSPAAAPAIGPVDPPTLAEAASVLDLAALPKMPGAEKVELRSCMLSYRAPGGVADGARFLREQLTSLGWTELPEPEATAANKHEFSQFTLTKDGFQVVAQSFKYADTPLSISIRNRGNLSAATLPVFPGATPKHVGFSMALYEVAASPDQLLMFVREEMAKRGWQAYREPTDVYLADKFAKRAAAGQHSLRFMKNGATVSVSVNKSADHAALQYTLDMKGYELPYPADATEIIFEDERPLLVCLTRMSADPLLDFYRTEMGRLGYQASTVGDASANQTEFSNARQAPLRLGLAPVADDLTYAVLAPAAEDVSVLLKALQGGTPAEQP